MALVGAFMFAGVASAAAFVDDIPGEPARLNVWTSINLFGGLDDANDSVYSISLKPGDELKTICISGHPGMDLFGPGSTSVDVDTPLAAANAVDAKGWDMLLYKAPVSGIYYVDVWAPSNVYGFGDQILITVRPATQLRLAGPATEFVSYGQQAGITCEILDGAGAPLTLGARVQLHKSVNGGPWIVVDLPSTTEASRSFSEAVYVKTAYKLVVPDHTTMLGSTSVIKTVVPKVPLGAPVAPSKVTKGKSFLVYGALKPAHAKGTKPVRIYKYRKVKGKWKAEGYVKATATNYKGYTRYKANLKLTKKGQWRLRACAPADAEHAETWSAKYDNVTVK